VFEPGSQLRSFRAFDFANCSSLQTLSIPSLTKVVILVANVLSLSVLMFDRPSHVRTLHVSVPCTFCGERLEIPDSTSEVFVSIREARRSPLVLDFGRESRLIAWDPTGPASGILNVLRPPLFARLSERTLRYFRDIVE
jgi:hypothetical protein